MSKETHAQAVKKPYGMITAADIAAVEPLMSKDAIDGSDGDEFVAGTIFLYKTSEGRLGKCRVDALGEGHSLILNWMTFNSDGSEFTSGNQLVVQTSFPCDLDFGAVGPFSKVGQRGDFWYQGVTLSSRKLVPQNAARFLIIRNGNGVPGEAAKPAADGKVR